MLEIKRSGKSDTSRLKMDGSAEARLLELACSEAPEGRARWTLRLLEEKAKVVLDDPVSKDTIRRALKKQTSTSQKHILVYPPKGIRTIRSLHGRCSRRL